MLSSFIITFRESLEVALLLGIIFTYLNKTNQQKFNTVVYFGLVSGIIASIAGAWLFIKLAGGFSGRAEQLFEGITMLISATLLTSMIFWMTKRKGITKKIEQQVEKHLQKSKRLGLFLLVSISVLREGIETVIFLASSKFSSSDNNLLGALLGLIAATGLGYSIFVGMKKINLKLFFTTTSIILLLFAAGFVGKGINELQDAQVIPPIISEIWNTNPSITTEGTYPLLHEKGLLGSFLKQLFGYNPTPSLLEVTIYITYLATTSYLILNKKSESSQ
ncbi:MAG: FTR1 family protein [bacterium]